MRDDWSEVFDRALRLRDAGVFDEGIAILRALTTVLDPVEERRLLVHSYMQIARMHWQLDDREAAVVAFRRATAVAPKSELASLGLYHLLWELDRKYEALRELQRYVELVPNSAGYRELLEGGYSGFSDEDRELLDDAHARLLRFN